MTSYSSIVLAQHRTSRFLYKILFVKFYTLNVDTFQLVLTNIPEQFLSTLSTYVTDSPERTVAGIKLSKSDRRGGKCLPFKKEQHACIWRSVAHKAKHTFMCLATAKERQKIISCIQWLHLVN